MRCRLDAQCGGADVVVSLPRIWWRLVTPGEPPPPWADKAQKMTREEFQTLASTGTEVRIAVPARVPRLRVGFGEGEDGGVSYSAKRAGPRGLCAVPLADFRDHSEIDQGRGRASGVERRS